MSKAIDVSVQAEVLGWANYANSVNKIEFIKGFLSTCNSLEIHHLKNVIGHRLKRQSCKLGKWTGPSWTEYKKFREGIPPSESRPTEANNVESGPEGVVIPDQKCPWWKKDFKRRDVIALDVEKVHLKYIEGIGREKPGIVSIVDSHGTELLNEKVYQKPGTFLCHPKMVEVSGIDKESLKDGMQWSQLKDKIKSIVKGKLVITVNGYSDLLCLELEREDYGDHFDLQEFHRRPHPDVVGDTQPMSLRDMNYFYFQNDCQPHGKPHTALDDARATMKIFISGYIPRKLKNNFCDKRGNFGEADFDHAVKVKKFKM